MAAAAVPRAFNSWRWRAVDGSAAAPARCAVWAKLLGAWALAGGCFSPLGYLLAPADCCAPTTAWFSSSLNCSTANLFCSVACISNSFISLSSLGMKRLRQDGRSGRLFKKISGLGYMTSVSRFISVTEGAPEALIRLFLVLRLLNRCFWSCYCS